MKIYISVDIEGATGIASFSQCSRPDSAHYDYPFARRMLTGDVNAAIRGARAGGATEVVVKDSHATCKNLLIDELEPGTQLISGMGAGTLGMMEGIDSSFSASMLVGYHAMAGGFGMMEHALVGGLHRLAINGEAVGEIAVSAVIAGAFGVPTVFVSSDQGGCDEAIACLPGRVQTFATKRGFGYALGQLLSPSVTIPGIEEAARQAVLNAATTKPYAIGGPVKMSVAFRTSPEADMAATLIGVSRTDAYTVEFSADSFLEAHRLALNVFTMSIVGRRSGD